MTAHVPMARVPFAPLDNPRLQHLASAKNRQNGVNLAAAQKSGKTNMNHMKTSSSASNKRAYEPCTFDEFDGENVDPAMFDSPSKKTKGSAFDLKQHKSFTFSLTTSKPMATMAPPPKTFSASASASASPRALSTPLRRKMASPRAPLTAPAGRSPKRKLLGVGGAASRRISAPFTRVDPPSFGSSSSSSSASALPFSLDAALSGSLPHSSAKMASSPSGGGGGATIAESMPQNWFFEIYQDTPEEEAANLMEHSTLTLDLSSDDEGEMGKKEVYRGKENTPPEGYDAPTASSPRAAAAAAPTEMVRKKVLAEDEMDDGSRSPLSDLETEDFFPEGLSKESFVVVDEEKTVAVVAAAAAVKVVVAEEVVDLPVVDTKGDVKGEIIVWEDEDVI